MTHPRRILRKVATLTALTALLGTGLATATMTSAAAADGTVTGTVSAANRPSAPGYVRALQWDGDSWNYEGDADISRTSKSYSLSVPPGANYVFCATTGDTPWFCSNGTWGYPENAPGAGTTTVPDGGAVTVNLAIPAVGAMNGAVTGAGGPEAWVDVELLRWNGAAFGYFDYDSTNSKGLYDMSSVPPGTYTMYFERDIDAAPGYEIKWLGGNTAEPTTPSGAGVFTIGVQDTVKNFNFDGPSPAPTATTLPSLPATSTVGQKLTLNPGVWTETPTFTYQWLRNGTTIAGAVGTTYTVTAADAGTDLTVRVGATQTGSTPGSAVSTASEVQQLKSTVTAKGKPDTGSKSDTVKIKAKVKVTGLAASGKVKVTLDGKTVSKGKVENGKATLSLKLKKLEPGKNKLKVEYLGSTAVKASKGKVAITVTS